MPDVSRREQAIRQARQALARLAARQRGLVTRQDLLALGFTATQIERMLADGRLIRVHRGVYAVGHGALTREAHWLAATLAVGPDAALCTGPAARCGTWATRPPRRST